MNLTVEAVKNKKFEGSKRGYNPEQVDEFLDLVCTDLQELHRKLEMAERNVERYREMEGTLTCVLVSAQNNAQKIEEEARVRADTIIKEAEEKAKKMRLSLEADAYKFREKSKLEQQELAKRVNELRGYYDTYKAAILHELADFKEKIEKVQPAQQLWEERPAELAQAVVVEDSTAQPEPAQAEEKTEEVSAGDFDMSDILKNLPESDSELKAMIEELI